MLGTDILQARSISASSLVRNGGLRDLSVVGIAVNRQVSRSSRGSCAPAGALGDAVLGTELARETAVMVTGYLARISVNFLRVMVVGVGVGGILADFWGVIVG